MIKVVHCEKESYDIYIGRERGTNQHFGNPFRIGDWGYTRKESIKAFSLWIKGEDFLDLEQERRQWILDNLHTLEGQTLGCWCKPLPCHGDVYAEIIAETKSGIIKL
jgi:hypothetical protein